MKVTIEDLKQIRNYFGEHDVSIFEHKAFDVIDALIKEKETNLIPEGSIHIPNCEYCNGTGEIPFAAPTVGKMYYYRCLGNGIFSGEPIREHDI